MNPEWGWAMYNQYRITEKCNGKHLGMNPSESESTDSVTMRFFPLKFIFSAQNSMKEKSSHTLFFSMAKGWQVVQLLLPWFFVSLEVSEVPRS